MATIIGSCCSFLVPNQRFIRARNSRFNSLRSPTIRAASSAIETKPDLTADAKVNTSTNCLACPICYYPLINRSEQTTTTTSGSSIECNTCKKSYINNDIYLDLTVSGGIEEYNETMPAATELFSLKWLKATLGPP